MFHQGDVAVGGFVVGADEQGCAAELPENRYDTFDNQERLSNQIRGL